jgi:predicted phosphodiesterase
MTALNTIKKTVFLLICSLIVTTVTSQSSKPTLQFRTDGKFKIMQLTDIHYRFTDPEYAPSSIAFIREAVGLVQPDLIMLTGDIVTATNTREAWEDIVEVLNESQIPWAVVFGNHDSEYELSNQEIISLLSKYPNNLTEDGPEDVTGNGNYVLTVKSSASVDKTVAVLYCFDTRKQHLYLTYQQMDWYRQQSRSFTAQNGGVPLPALAFYHIPIPEYAEIIGKPTTVGIANDEVCSPKLNSGSLVAMHECGDVMGIFVGHDHDNNYIGCLHNICLAYGYKSGRQGYGDIGRGVRVIELCESERKFTTWLLKLYDSKSRGTTWEHVQNITPQFVVTYPESFQ